MEIAAKTEVEAERRKPRTISAAAVLACAWPALLLATVCLLPYLNKPYINDDPWFLTMAQQIVRHPAQPPEFTMCWTMPEGCYKVTPGNALAGEEAQGYLLVPTILTGAHEWTAHLTQLVLVWIALAAMASLALRFGWDRQRAMLGALLLAAVAPFLPMASTAMPDTLATALALVAMERLAAWKAEQKWSQCAAAAVALGLAGIARPHLVLLLPLAAFFLLESAQPKELWRQLRRGFRLWTPVFAGCAILLAIVLITRKPELVLKPVATMMGLQNVGHNLVAFLLYLVFPIPLAACWLANRLKTAPLRIVIVVAVAGAVSFLQPGLRLVLLLATVGLGMLIDLLYEALDKAEVTGLFLMLWILIPLPIVDYLQLPAKLLLPCIPAAILLCFRLMACYPLRVSRAIAIGLIAASACYSLLILRADAEFAEFGRDSMYRLISPHVAAGQKVWFANQFSAYWYAPLAGATLVVPGGPQPRPGDLLVVGIIEGGAATLAHFPHRALVDEMTHEHRFGRTWGSGVNLYSNRGGYWMWGLGDSADDRYELWRIN